MDVFVPKKEDVLKKTFILLSLLVDKFVVHNLSVPCKQGITNSKVTYDHVILGP